jgi:hypothetical protein
MRTSFIISFVVFSGSIWAQPPTSFTRTMTFAPVGVATSETVQVNVSNSASNSSATPASCSGTITFTVPAAKNQPAAVKFTVSAGQLFSTDLAWGSLGVSGRAEILASIQLTQSFGTPCSLITSLETFDSSTGVTHSYQSNPSTSGIVVPLAGGH